MNQKTLAPWDEKIIKFCWENLRSRTREIAKAIGRSTDDVYLMCRKMEDAKILKGFLYTPGKEFDKVTLLRRKRHGSNFSGLVWEVSVNNTKISPFSGGSPEKAVEIFRKREAKGIKRKVRGK